MTAFYSKDFLYSTLAPEIAQYEATVTSSDLVKIAPDSGAWDGFYATHSNRFFLPRNYLPACFPVILSPGLGAEPLILECGSGNGANVLSLLSVLSSGARIFAADASQASLDALALSPSCYAAVESKRLTLLLWDITTAPPPALLPHAGAAAPKTALALLFFTLSAVSPALHLDALKNVCAVLEPGKGQLCFRDYGYGDIAQLRFGSTLALSRSTHQRPDGTLSHYFTLPEISALMEAAGFSVLELDFHLVENVNRKTGQNLKRVFLHCLAKRNAVL